MTRLDSLPAWNASTSLLLVHPALSPSGARQDRVGHEKVEEMVR